MTQVSATGVARAFGNLYVNTGSLTQVSATGVARAFGNLYVNTAALAQANVNATATALTGYEYGFSEASCSVTARSPLANIQVIASITNATATVLGVTNVNAYLNQINCLASVSEESQTTIAIPQQTYITATASSLIGFGISEANATVTVASIFANVQINAAITNATAVSPLYVNTALIQVGANANVYNFGNLYVNTGSLTQANTTIVARTPTTTYSCNVYIFSNYASTFLLMEDGISGFELEDDSGVLQLENSGVTTIINTGVGGVIPSITARTLTAAATTEISSFTPNVQVNAISISVTTGFGSVFGKIQVTSPVAAAIGSAGSLRAYGFSEANASVVVASVYGNVQVVSPTVHATATASNFYAYGFSEANASVVVASVYGNVQVNAVSISANANVSSVVGNVQVTARATITTSALSLYNSGIQVNCVLQQ